jgi:hypothetical protein
MKNKGCAEQPANEEGEKFNFTQQDQRNFSIKKDFPPLRAFLHQKEREVRYDFN